MTIDKAIRYAYADDDGDWRDKKNLPKNVLPFIFKKPFLQEIQEMEEDDDEARNRVIKIASAPHPDESWFGLWEDLDSQGMVPKSIRNLTEFKKWFYKQNLDVEMFSRGGSVNKQSGLASLRRLIR